jgi:hypothetical protein
VVVAVITLTPDERLAVALARRQLAEGRITPNVAATCAIALIRIADEEAAMT